MSETAVTMTTNDIDLMIPGSGWSNGAITTTGSATSSGRDGKSTALLDDVSMDVSLYSHTQRGKKSLFSEHRRWIGLVGSGWTRLGETGHEHDRSTSSSSNLPTTITNNNKESGGVTMDDVHEQAYAVRSLIAQLCETFYHMGWATGTGGGCSIRVLHPILSNDNNTIITTDDDDMNNNKQWRVFVAPSGIQKEDMIGDDIFELDMNRNVIVPPKTVGLRQSACTPLWYVVYKHRPSATCVIHTHSMNAVQATLLDPTEQSTYVRITHLEMLKGVGCHGYDDYLDIPIIDNRPTEDLLASQLEVAIQQYPKCNAVLVRRHGIYCWGDTWEQAKTQCESFDYLFDCIIKMKSMGVDYSTIPPSGTYRDGTKQAEDTTKGNVLPGNSTGTGTNTNHDKKRKVEEVVARTDVTTTNNNINSTTGSNTTNHSNGFNGIEAIDNTADCLACPVPLLPRDHERYKYVLLDIEGCTTSISFVKDLLFPYARTHLSNNCTTLAINDPIKYSELMDALRDECNDHSSSTTMEDMALYLMDQDRKCAPLKTLQGMIWEEGYNNGTIQGHVYSDIPIALEWFRQHNVPVGIYSSGSISAQQLLFRTTKFGNLLPYIQNHFDISTSGSKMESLSYVSIANALQIPIESICFVSDSTNELIAAQQAGMKATICSIRPGNVPISTSSQQQQQQPSNSNSSNKIFPTIHSLLQLCGAE